MDRPLEDANKLIAIENTINLIVLFKRIGFEAFMVCDLVDFQPNMVVGGDRREGEEIDGK